MSLVIATAGHVDHGKSTLVHALTGMDPDRLDSEKQRGLTIELGFAWTQTGGRSVAFVDVPGHERFITTMLSGVGSVPVALLVVAADDPWMPQSAEHLAALDALGVEHGIVAITRSDLADPAPAAARARKELSHTHLAGAPVIPVSAHTGAGIDVLRLEIAALADRLPHPDPLSDVRLWVDRHFTIAGAGTVVTGTLPAGTVEIGDELLSPAGPVRIRGLQSQGETLEQVTGPARVALNLTGETTPFSRGTPLWSRGHWHISDRLDVRLHKSGPLPRTPMVHVGAHSSLVRVRMIDPTHAQIHLDVPLPWRQGDRFLLRDPGNRHLWGATALDPAATPFRGTAARAKRAALLAARGTTPDYNAEVTQRSIVTGDLLRSLGIPDGDEAPWHVSPAWARHTAERIRDLVTTHDAKNPANPGLAPAEIIHALDLPADLPTAHITALLPEGLKVSGGRVSSRQVEVPPRVLKALATFNPKWQKYPFVAPTLEELRTVGLTDADLGAAARAKRIFLPAPGVVLPTTAPSRAVETLRQIPSPFTMSEARAALGTSRRVAIPVLEFLDRARITRRLPDDRREFL